MNCRCLTTMMITSLAQKKNVVFDPRLRSKPIQHLRATQMQRQYRSTPSKFLICTSVVYFLYT